MAGEVALDPVPDRRLGQAQRGDRHLVDRRIDQLAELTRRIVHARADTIPHPRIARAYRNLLLDAGFHDVDIEVHTAVFTDPTMLPMPIGHATAAHQAGAITGDEADNWISEQTRRAHDDRLLVAIPMFLAAATR